MLEAEIAQARQDLAEAVQDLKAASQRLNLARRIGERPGPWLAAGFAVGLLWGLCRR